MKKKISGVSMRQVDFGIIPIEGFSGGIWETDEIIVGENEIDNFCYIFLFPSDEDSYSSGCGERKFQLCFAFAGHLHRWKFEKNTIVYYFIIGNSIVPNIPALSHPSIHLLRQFPSINLTTFEFDKVNYEFTRIHEEMNRLDMLERIIFLRIDIIFDETYRFIEKRYANNTNA